MVSGSESEVSSARRSGEKKIEEGRLRVSEASDADKERILRDASQPWLAYWRYGCGEWTVDVRYGFHKIPLFNVLINDPAKPAALPHR